MRVKPRAARDAVQGERDGALVVGLRAAPVEGAANLALVRMLARLVGLAPSSVKILRGATGRDKLLRFEGLTAGELRARIPEVPK